MASTVFRVFLVMAVILLGHIGAESVGAAKSDRSHSVRAVLTPEVLNDTYDPLAPSTCMHMHYSVFKLTV